MFKHLSTACAMFALAAGSAIVPSAFGQAVQKNTDTSNILVAIDGVTCNAAGPTGFPALSFHVGVTTSSSGGGGGGDKAFFSVLTLTRMFDSCSPRLLQLAATQQHVKRVTITNLDKSNQPIATILLEDVVVGSLQVADPDDAANTTEKVTLDYAKMTLTELPATEVLSLPADQQCIR